VLTACQRSREEPAPGGAPKPLVIATFYPLHEFARQVGGGIEVAALVPPGIEPHHWVPAPSDLRVGPLQASSTRRGRYSVASVRRRSRW
jgi:zinc transport system substrate-binding protein